MDYKALADEYTEELKIALEKISTLRRALAEHGEQTKNSKAVDEDQKVAELQRQLQGAQVAKEHCLRQAAETETRLQNTLNKVHKVESDLQQQRRETQTLRNQLAGKTEQLRNTQVIRATDLAGTKREQQLQVQVRSLKGEVHAANAEIGKLRTAADGLQKQLQAEKSANADRLDFMKAAAGKPMYDEDDEEILPRSVHTVVVVIEVSC